MYINEAIAKLIDAKPKKIMIVQFGEVFSYCDSIEEAEKNVQEHNSTPKKKGKYFPKQSVLVEWPDYLHDANEALKAMEWLGQQKFMRLGAPVCLKSGGGMWWIQGLREERYLRPALAVCKGFVFFMANYGPEGGAIDYETITW